MKTMMGMVATARSVTTANTHRHEVFSATKPEIAGDEMGPNVVATINQAMESPRSRGSLYTSAYSPPVIAMGPENPTPHMKRKKSSDGQFGATAHAMLKSVAMEKNPSMTRFRPLFSDRGPQSVGPMT